MEFFSQAESAVASDRVKCWQFRLQEYPGYLWMVSGVLLFQKVGGQGCTIFGGGFVYTGLVLTVSIFEVLIKTHVCLDVPAPI